MLSTMQQRINIIIELKDKPVVMRKLPRLTYIDLSMLKEGMLVEARYFTLPWVVIEVGEKTITFLRRTYEYVNGKCVYNKIPELYVETDMSIKYGYGGKVKVETITNVNSNITHKLIGGIIMCGSDSTQNTIINENNINCKKCLLI